MSRDFQNHNRFAARMRKPEWAAIGVVVCLSVAVVRTLASGHGSMPPLADNSADCPPGGAAREPAKRLPLNRLSKAEYSQTIWDLIGPDIASALPGLPGVLAGIPDDDRQAGFANLNWTLSANHVSAYLGVANEIGTQVTQQAALREKFLPCATELANIDDRCMASFVDSFAVRAYRRPLHEAEREGLLGYFRDAKRTSRESALASLIMRVLMSPNFLFKAEDGAAYSAGGCAERLDGDSFTLASRIAYGLWGRMPDAELFAAARQHDLLDDAKLTAQIERMLHDDRAKSWMQTFFREWLHYDRMNVEGYSWDFVVKLDRAHLHQHAAEELDRFIDAVVWTDNGTFYDLMTSRKVFTDSPSIRSIYGLPRIRPDGPEDVPATRAGLLTRAALLMQGEDVASPIKRGAFVRRQILCDALSPPDASLLPPGSLVPPEPDYRLTTRQRWEARTAPAACQGCHRRINAFGFALEAYDGVGRFRKIEHQLIPKSTPPAYRDLTIDAAVVPNVERGDEPRVENAAALSEFIGKSTKANVCFVKQLTKFVSGRPVAEDDLDALTGLAGTMMQSGGNIHDTLVGIVKGVVRRHGAAQ